MFNQCQGLAIMTSELYDTFVIICNTLIRLSPWTAVFSVRRHDCSNCSFVNGCSAEIHSKTAVGAQTPMARALTRVKIKNTFHSTVAGTALASSWLPYSAIRYKFLFITLQDPPCISQHTYNHYSPDTFPHVLCDQANRCNCSFQERTPESEPEPSVWQHQPSGTVFH